MHNVQRFWRQTIIMVLVALAVIPAMGHQSVSAQESLYQEGFENGQPAGWELESGWSVAEEATGHILAGMGHFWARSNQVYDGDYALSFRLKVLRGTIHLVFNLNDAGRYFVAFDSQRSQLNKQHWPDKFELDLASGNTPHSLNNWHQVEIVVRDNTSEFLVDGIREWIYTDAQPFRSGSFAFETLDNAQVYIDDIAVKPGATSAPTAAPPSSNTPVSVSGLAWTRLGGPLGGLGYDIRMVPGATDHMYVTDAWAGVHVSTDGGLTWIPSNDGIVTRTGESGDAIPVFSLTIDPNNPHILWAGTQYQRGIYKSADAGRTWTKMDRGIAENNGITFRGFTIQPGDSDVVYAAAEISSWSWAGQPRNGREFDMVKGVVYETTNGGQSWKAIWRGENLARYVWIDPRDSNVLYISTGIFDREAANSDPEAGVPGGEGIVKSTDGGKSWTNINNGLGNLYVGSLFMHPQHPDTLLAGAGNNTYAQGAGVYLTTDGGESWLQTLSDSIIEAVEFSATDPNIVYAGSSESIYRSEDGGHTWKQVSGGSGMNGWGSPGVRAGFPIDFQVDLNDTDRIFANEYGGGNFLSEDGGRTWAVASTGYTGAQVRALAVHPTQPGQVYATARSGIFVTYDGGNQWVGLNTAPVRSMEWNAVALDPDNSAHILASNNWNFDILLSDDAGETWHFTGATLEGRRMGWRVIVFAPSDSDFAYAGSAGYFSAGTFDPAMPGDGIYSSQNGGRSWKASSDELMREAHVTGLAVHPGNPRLVFAAVIGKGILRSSDGGQTWEAASGGLRGLDALSIAIHPGEPEMLLAGFWGAGIYQSTDDGQKWQQSGHGLPPEASVTSIVFDPKNPQVVYAADVRSGVYRSENSGSSWQPIINGLRMRSVNALAISNDGQHLYAATEGEGVYRLDLNGQPPAPAPMPQSDVPTPGVTREASEPTSVTMPTPDEVSTSTSSDAPESPGNPVCGGAGLIPLGVMLLAGWRRRGERASK